MALGSAIGIFRLEVFDVYIVLEIQKYNSGTVALVPPSTHERAEDAEQKYHTALSYAAVLAVNVHSVVMLNDMGERIKGETYYHGGTE